MSTTQSSNDLGAYGRPASGASPAAGPGFAASVAPGLGQPRFEEASGNPGPPSGNERVFQPGEPGNPDDLRVMPDGMVVRRLPGGGFMPTGQYIPQPQAGPPTREQQPVVGVVLQTNGMAVASLVLSILWIFWIGSVLGFIFGLAALSDIKNNPQQGGKGLAIAGTIISGVSLIPLAIIFITAIGVASS